jgi:hypothetical protein
VRKTILVAVLSLCFAATAFAQCETLTFLTESLPGFTSDTQANFQIEVIGGTAPYHFTLLEDLSVMPAGLHLTGSGKIVGKAKGPADTTIFVQVTDANGCTLTSAYAVRVDQF